MPQLAVLNRLISLLRSSELSKIVVLTKPAISDYQSISKANKPFAKRINLVLKELAKEPTKGIILKLDLRGMLSYKIGIYRIIYVIETSVLRVYSIRY